MGFLSNAWNAITKIAEAPTKIVEKVDPLAKPISKAVGMKDTPLTSFVNQIHRSAQDQYGQAAMPIVGGVAGTLLLGPGYGTALGAMAGRAVAGAERGESDAGIAKNTAITGAAAYAGGSAYGAGYGVGGTAGGIGAASASSGATTYAAAKANGASDAQAYQAAVKSMASSAASSGAGNYFSDTPIYNSEPGTDYSGALASGSTVPSMTSRAGSMLAGTGTGLLANSAWKPIVETPIQQNPYVQEGQSAQQNQWNPYGAIGETPKTAQELRINQLLQAQNRKSMYKNLFNP